MTETQEQDAPLQWQIDSGHIRKTESERGGVEYRVRRRPYTEPLLWLIRNNKIDADQFRAGRRFYTLWYFGGMSARPTLSRYGEVVGCVEAGAAEDLQRQYHFAREAIRGVKERRVAYEVCCEARGAGKNLAYLIAALDDLVTHFGY